MYYGNLPVLPGKLNWHISLITVTRWLRGNAPWEISGRKDTQIIQFDWKINFLTEPLSSRQGKKTLFSRCYLLDCLQLS